MLEHRDKGYGFIKGNSEYWGGKDVGFRERNENN